VVSPDCTVAIDRAATLRNAEKLLRQGKVDAAIAEYVRVVEEHPQDWNTANLLGDLYVRSGKTDRAVEQFARIADDLSAQGFLPKAAALYKKALKLKADHEHALLQAGEIAVQLGFFADARAHFGAVSERRKARGDARGSSEARIRLGTIDPTDYDARVAAANTRLEMDDVSGAVRDLSQIAVELREKDRRTDAVEVLRQAAALAPGDADIRNRLFDLSLAIVEQELRSGSVDAALSTAAHLLEEDPTRGDRIVAVGCSVAAEAPDVGLRVVEIAAGVSMAQRNWAAAAAAMQAFADAAPNPIPALMRLVEICVDGGLEAELPGAQTELADAYLAAGHAGDARFIAEDLVARDPTASANIDRLRRTLELLGEADPDAIIATFLAVQSPTFTAGLVDEDLSAPTIEQSVGTAWAPMSPELREHGVSRAESASVEQPLNALPPRWDPASRLESDEPEHPPVVPPRLPHTNAVDVFELSANAVDIQSILEEFEPVRRRRADVAAEHDEVDLSIVLDDIKRPPPIALRASRDRNGSAPPPVQGDDIERVFEQLRYEAARRSALDAAEQEFRRGLALKAAGDIDACVAALESASKAPRLRFATASLLGRIFRERGQSAKAAEWYERAAQAPAPTPDAYHQLLFELAEVLEAEGEIVRALAICLELQADAGDYRDVATRVDRLAKVQARG
jgi:tetratricopeptide (TPR) repeat protein